MKVFDSKGEYTPDEIKAALAGDHGTREVSYYYHRLDKNNQFLEKLDYVQSCTIENASLADIKRSAKIELIDTGSINYLQDRIKPYARLAMPKPVSHPDIVASMDPSLWYKFDDPNQLELSGEYDPIPSDLSHETFDDAYSLQEGYNVYPSIGATGHATLRDVLWVKIDVTESYPIDFFCYVDTPGSYTLEAFTLNGTTEADLVPIPGINSGTFSIYGGYPERNTYYVKVSGLSQAGTGAFEWARPSRVSDSSGNNKHMSTKGSSMGQPAVVSDGGTSIERGSSLFASRIDTVISTSYSGYTWINNVSDVEMMSASAYGNFNNDIDSAAKAPRRANIEIRIHFDERRVRIYGGFKNYACEVYWDFYPPANVDMTSWKHIAWSVDYTNHTSAPKVWVNGSILNYVPSTPTSVYGTWDDIEDPLINYFDISGDADANGHIYIDDTAVFFDRQISNTEVQRLYAIGTSEHDGRSGYVEWPLGVFVLSSPSRTMVDGNTVRRSVEGYDQLVTLREDSFDYRYSVSAGTKYTEAINAVLQTTMVPQNIPFTDAAWAISASSSILSESSAELGHETMAQNMATEFGSIALTNFSMSAKFSGLTSYSEFAIYAPNDYIGWLHDDSGQTDRIIAHFNNELWSANYSSIAHAYLRIREAGSYIYFETSSDGTTWVQRAAAVHRIPANASVQAYIGVDNQSIKTRITNFKLLASRLPKISLVGSDKILPTALDWEPGKSKLTIINDLLGAINYESAYYDEDGVFVGKPYISPAQRSAEFKYATDASSVITGNVNQTADLFGIPNKIIVAVSEPDRPPIVGTFVNSNPLSPTSTVSRGRTIVDFRTEQNAPDQITLDAQAARIGFEASQVYEVIEFVTAAMPIHENGDVFDLEIDGLEINDKYSEQSWSLQLESGATMTHRVRRVVNV